MCCVMYRWLPLAAACRPVPPRSPSPTPTPSPSLTPHRRPSPPRRAVQCLYYCPRLPWPRTVNNHQQSLLLLYYYFYYSYHITLYYLISNRIESNRRWRRRLLLLHAGGTFGETLLSRDMLVDFCFRLSVTGYN